MDQKAVEQKLKQLRENLAKINPYDQSRSVSIADAIEKMGQAEIISDDTDYWYHNEKTSIVTGVDAYNELVDVSSLAKFNLISVVEITYIDDPIMIAAPEVTYWSDMSSAQNYIRNTIVDLKNANSDLVVEDNGHHVRLIDTYNKVEIAAFWIVASTVYGAVLHAIK